MSDTQALVRPADGHADGTAAVGYVVATSDVECIRLWLHGKAPGTQAQYAADVRRFLEHVQLTLPAVTIRELIGYASDLQASGLAQPTINRKLACLKSLFTYADQIGYVPRNWGRMLRLPRVRDDLAERILPEPDVLRMIELETRPREHAILHLLYAAGLRVSELCGLRWRDVVERAGLKARRGAVAAQVTVMGKGSKTRTIALPLSVWQSLIAIRPAVAAPEAAVFASRRRGRGLSRVQVWRIVKEAALRAGVDERTSTHWLRHACASHALDHGANVALVQQGLGHGTLVTTSRYVHARPDDSPAMHLAA